MADNWTQNIACRYFKNGVCREGANCRYSHAQNTRNEMNQVIERDTTVSSTLPCRFFKQGSCRFGNQCRFSHNSSHQTNISSEITTEAQTSDELNIKNELDECGENKKNLSNTESWALAPEFVPSVISEDYIQLETESVPLSYAQAVNINAGQSSHSSTDPLCPYAEASGICKKFNCPYLHGNVCDMCGSAALHPYNEEQRKKHINACVKQHEIDMELSFAIARSREKSCGVCFETIMEKTSGEQRFGILPNCNHCFCLSCIRKWRKAKQFENKIIRGCPECRVPSDFVCPSIYWVETKEEKDKLITDYKDALSTKDCKYFNKGRGKCPFGNKCFYLHALPDGTKTDVGPPIRHRRNKDSEESEIFNQLVWDWVTNEDLVNHLADLELYNMDDFSDDDESFSDW